MLLALTAGSVAVLGLVTAMAIALRLERRSELRKRPVTAQTATPSSADATRGPTGDANVAKDQQLPPYAVRWPSQEFPSPATPPLLSSTPPTTVPPPATSCPLGMPKTAEGSPFRDWLQDLETAKRVAADEKKSVLLLFVGSDWCPPCRRFVAEVISDPGFERDVGRDFVLVCIDDPRGAEARASVEDSARNSQTSRKYGISSVPTVLLTDAQGRPFGRLGGYRPGGLRAFTDAVRETREGGQPLRQALARLDTAADEATRRRAVAEAMQLIEERDLQRHYAHGIEAVGAAGGAPHQLAGNGGATKTDCPPTAGQPEELAVLRPPEKRPEGMSPKEFLRRWGLVESKNGLWLLEAETTMHREANQLNEQKLETTRKENVAKLAQKRWQDTERMFGDLQKQFTAMTDRLHRRGVVTRSELQALSMAEIQLDQAKLGTDQAKRQADDTRAAANTAVAAFAADVAKQRQKHQQADRTYAVLHASPVIRQALVDLSSGADAASIGPAEGFRFCARKLAEFESLVAAVSARVPIVQRGSLWYVDVELNGKKKLEMAIDTGAEVLCVSWNTAVEAGLDPDRGRPTRMQVADGTTTLARTVKVPVVRVGDFTAANVECTVLPRTAGEATPLLGQAFLSAYHYQIDAGERMLVLSGPPKDKPPAASGRK